MREKEKDQLHISRRLELLADMLPAVDTVCDVGADHAWLLIRLWQLGKIRRGLGVEVTEGPFCRAKENIASYGLEGKLTVRFGDGLAPLQPGEAQAAVIAGMGGGTITGILERSPKVQAGLQYLLLQPMSQPAMVRHFLQGSGFCIVREELLEERGILYPAILAVPGKMAPLREMEAEFGPLLLQTRPPELLAEIRRQLSAWQRVKTGLEKSRLSASREKEIQVRSAIRKLEELIECLYPAEKSSKS